MEKGLIIKNNILKNASLLNLKLLILITPLVIYKYVDRFRANQEAWLKLFVIFGLTLWILKCLENSKIIWKRNKLNFFIVFFSIIMSISLLISDYIIVSLKEYLIFIFYFIVYFLVITNIEDERQFYSLISLFYITSFIVSIYTILHYYEFIPYLKEFGTVMSTIGQKNWISNYLALILPIILSFFLLEEVKKNKIFYCLLLAIIYITLLICQSRGIWISIFFTLLTGIILVYKYRLFKIFKENKKWLALILVTFIIITVIYSTDNPLNKSVITAPQRAMSTFDVQDPSINGRLLIWKTTLEMIKDKPLFGLGIGTFKMSYLVYQAEYLKINPSHIKYSGKAEEAHNEYLQMGAELGIVGVYIFLGIFYIFYSLVLNYLKKEKSNRNKIIILGLVMGITSFLIHSLFSFPFHVPALGSAFFLILGLTTIYLKGLNFSEFNNYKDREEKTNKTKYLKLFILFIILILLFMVFVIESLVVRSYLAEVYAYKGRENLVLTHYNNALPNFEYAAKLDPYNGRILLNLGATYYNLGMFEEAKNKIEQSKKYYNDYNIYRNLGLYYSQQENVIKAEKEFKYAIYLNPKFISAHSDLAYLYVKQNEYDKAIIEWNKILKIDADLSEKYNVLYFIGIAYQKKEMPNKALEYFLQALVLVPEGDPIEKEIEEEINNLYKSKL